MMRNAMIRFGLFAITGERPTRKNQIATTKHTTDVALLDRYNSHAIIDRIVQYINGRNLRPNSLLSRSTKNRFQQK